MITLLAMNFLMSALTSGKVGASFTMLFVMPVREVMKEGILLCGFISVEYLSIVLNVVVLLSTFTLRAENSVILCMCLESPVVSMSSITNFVFSMLSPLFLF